MRPVRAYATRGVGCAPDTRRCDKFTTSAHNSHILVSPLLSSPIYVLHCSINRMTLRSGRRLESYHQPAFNGHPYRRSLFHFNFELHYATIAIPHRNKVSFHKFWGWVAAAASDGGWGKRKEKKRSLYEQFELFSTMVASMDVVKHAASGDNG